jgi:ATP adenylyltransferase/5',5'''-P-1,P-4-tetraphosphate phosphorylase II
MAGTSCTTACACSALCGSCAYHTAASLSAHYSGPDSTKQQQQKPAAVRNPFLPYEEELWVEHLSDTHTLLLNKFNVVPHHVLVVTRQFESQQDPLNSRDLAATQQVNSAGWGLYSAVVDGWHIYQS